MSIIEPINQFRVEEKNGLFVQFFDKKRQKTNEDLETIDILDESGKPIYDLYVEIFNKDDPFSIVCKKVEGNTIAIVFPNGVRKHFKYTEIYAKAFAKYKERKAIADKENGEIEKLKVELEELKKKNKVKEKNKPVEEIETNNNVLE